MILAECWFRARVPYVTIDPLDYVTLCTVNFSYVEKLRLRFACCTCIGLCANTQFRRCCVTAGTIEFVYAKLCTHQKRKRN